MTEQKRARGRPRLALTESSAGTLQSLDRALGLLKTLAAQERATLSDLARSLSLPPATAHRILMTLQAHGFLFFDGDRQEWSIGVEAYRVGAAFLKRNSVLDIGQPVMRQLMVDTGETANLAVADGATIVFVRQVETANPIRAFFPNGTRTSMHASGVGKAILAAMPEPALAKILAETDFDRFTDSTHESQEALRADLADIRQRGWAIDREERFAGMSCIGAAIMDDQNLPFAGISVSGPSARFDATALARLGPQVARAAAMISSQIGGQIGGQTGGQTN